MWGVLWICFFFFKQKTAYEIRNCDWSSDVCSSDLREKELGKDSEEERKRKWRKDESKSNTEREKETGNRKTKQKRGAKRNKKDKLNNTPFNPLTKNKMNRHKTTTDKNNSRIIVSKDKKNEIKTNEQVIDKNNLSKGAKKIKNLIDRSRVSHPKCYKDKKSLYKTNKKNKTKSYTIA